MNYPSYLTFKFDKSSILFFLLFFSFSYFGLTLLVSALKLVININISALAQMLKIEPNDCISSSSNIIATFS